MLYIQMELCGSTLKDWICDRNESYKTEEDFLTYLKTDECLMIFKHILQAVRFIHEHSLIHRDLKPQNVFMLKNKHVKVGDFGLATSDIFNENESSGVNCGVELDGKKRSRHTSGVGTPTYAAPEQLDGSRYSNKVDVYSLGVILFELYQKLDSEHERGTLMKSLKEGILPETLRECWPVQASYIKSMTSHDPNARPSVNEILTDKELFLSKNQIIAELKRNEQLYTDRIKQGEKSVKKMQKRLNQKKAVVEKMREESGRCALEILELKRSIVKMKEEQTRTKIKDTQPLEGIKLKPREAGYIVEINKLKASLKKKDTALERMGALLKMKDGIIQYLIGSIDCDTGPLQQMMAKMGKEEAMLEHAVSTASKTINASKSPIQRYGRRFQRTLSGHY